ncbi:MAG TPA: hypothetical protein RMF84_17760 [Polyangiaceae bacterium LLY-WYZ-14_1]|nr:hypothetical protein [Polyangiaceae bacterium LLY-WYZ-14_1]
MTPPRPPEGPGKKGAAVLGLLSLVPACSLVLDYDEDAGSIVLELRILQANTEREPLALVLDGRGTGLRSPGAAGTATRFVELPLSRSQIDEDLPLALVDASGPGPPLEVVAAARPLRVSEVGPRRRPITIFVWENAQGDLVLDHAGDRRGPLEEPELNVGLRLLHLEPRFPVVGVYALDASEEVAVAVVSLGGASPFSEFPFFLARWGLDTDPALDLGADLEATYPQLPRGEWITIAVTPLSGQPGTQSLLLFDDGQLEVVPTAPIPEAP